MLKFFVRGDPATQGSKRAIFIPKLNRAIVTEDCKRNKSWRSDVRNEAQIAVNHSGWQITDKPIKLQLTFVLRRPKSHYNSKGVLRPNAPTYHTKKPDTVKLARAVEDALKGLVWADDSQVCEEIIIKRYDSAALVGVVVTVEIL